MGNLIEALYRGKQVADPATWKNRALATNAVSGLLIAAFSIAKVFGYVLPVDDATIELASSGLVALVLAANAVVHVASSTKVGLPPKEQPQPLYPGGSPPGLG